MKDKLSDAERLLLIAQLLLQQDAQNPSDPEMWYNEEQDWLEEHDDET